MMEMKIKESGTMVGEKRELQKEKRKTSMWLQKHGEGLSVIGSGLLTLAAWMLEDSYFSSVSIFLFLTAYFLGGYRKAKDGILTLVHERELDVNLLMLLAAIGAASIGYWLEGSILIFIFALSGVMESYTMAKSYRDIASLMDMKPEMALRYDEGKEEWVKIEELKMGDLVIVKPGERIPADGVILEGASFINQAAITGESIPVEKGENDAVFSGTLNGHGSLMIKVSCTSESTLFSKIIRMVQEAQSEKPISQKFMERFERIYAKAVLSITVLLISFPPLLLGWEWEQTMYRAMVFLVVASPCALVASIMPVMLSAISSAARKGVLFKGGAHLENLSEIKAIAVDKTGTLTQGRPRVKDIVPLQGYSDNQLLEIAGAMESLSEHPISLAIVQKTKECGVDFVRPAQIQAHPGFGIEAEYAGQTWRIGKAAFFEASHMTDQVCQMTSQFEGEGKTVIYVGNEKGLAGILSVQDTIREETKATIQRLKEMGISVVMLTGDRKTTADAIAAEAGVDYVFAELLPENKVEKVKELKDRFGKVAMLGDGVNDAPALATATVGIAMGATGSDVALETADLVLMNDDLDKIPDAILTSRKAKRVIRQNMVFSLSIIILLILSNLSQNLSLPLGVIGHEGSTILVILNGLRLLKR